MLAHSTLLHRTPFTVDSRPPREISSSTLIQQRVNTVQFLKGTKNISIWCSAGGKKKIYIAATLAIFTFPQKSWTTGLRRWTTRQMVLMKCKNTAYSFNISILLPSIHWAAVSLSLSLSQGATRQQQKLIVPHPLALIGMQEKQNAWLDWWTNQWERNHGNGLSGFNWIFVALGARLIETGIARRSLFSPAEFKLRGRGRLYGSIQPAAPSLTPCKQGPESKATLAALFVLSTSAGMTLKQGYLYPPS